MTQYVAPLRDMQFVLHELLEVQKEFAQLPAYAELDSATIDQVIESAGKFCEEVLFPLNRSADEQGCTYTNNADNSVITPKGFKAAYQQYVDAGWPALACDPQYGGQGLPVLIYYVLYEMLSAANQAWTLYPALSQGAYACLHAHGTTAQKAIYLPKLASGVWTGTMCLTEAHCGTDLGLLRTKAQPQADGAYCLTGTKIFITSGEHDLAENIVHLVLARLPDAPQGSQGISLFVVPKFIPDAQGGLGARNPVRCASIEHKMGIHGNATCVLHFDGARAELVGEPNRGLRAMFVMMNAARLGVGIQGLGLTEVSYQNARAYARERLQMRALSGAKRRPDSPNSPNTAADPIINHPDVRHKLLTQKAYVEAGRAFAYWLALQIDCGQSHPDPSTRCACQDLVALLTPIAKAFLTDNGFDATNLGMQVFGGHGYIRESGMEQYVRDVRISTIYEGTNTIQALDLLHRKVLGDMGAKLKAFAQLIQRFIDEEGIKPEMQEFIDPLAEIGERLKKLTMNIGIKALQNPEEAAAAAVPYLRLLGHLIFAYFWARMARVALDKQGCGDPFYLSKLATARFYFAKLLPETAFYFRVVETGAASVMALDDAYF